MISVNETARQREISLIEVENPVGRFPLIGEDNLSFLGISTHENCPGIMLKKFQLRNRGDEF